MEKSFDAFSVEADENYTIQTKNGELKVPCLKTMIVPIDMVVANNYNPNVVPRDKMKDLSHSIETFGICYPTITVFDPDREVFVIVDGFHRYTDYLNRGATHIAIIALDLNVKKRMSATVLFNRARGVHQVELMGDLVRSMAEQGADDIEIGKSLGMDIEEVYRLKQITGIAELFKNQVYSRAWEMVDTDNMEVEV